MNISENINFQRSATIKKYDVIQIQNRKKYSSKINSCKLLRKTVFFKMVSLFTNIMSENLTELDLLHEPQKKDLCILLFNNKCFKEESEKSEVKHIEFKV